MKTIARGLEYLNTGSAVWTGALGATLFFYDFHPPLWAQTFAAIASTHVVGGLVGFIYLLRQQRETARKMMED